MRTRNSVITNQSQPQKAEVQTKSQPTEDVQGMTLSPSPPPSNDSENNKDTFTNSKEYSLLLPSTIPTEKEAATAVELVTNTPPPLTSELVQTPLPQSSIKTHENAKNNLPFSSTSTLQSTSSGKINKLSTSDV